MFQASGKYIRNCFGNWIVIEYMQTHTRILFIIVGMKEKRRYILVDYE